MSKLLSIIIPTYNMEALLPRCLDSILVEGALERVEAMVVNDGSKDGSLAVANSYKERFPASVTVIDKPNGNYGSTINAALPVAQGKYIRILDSDDWVRSDSLVSFLDALENLDTDMAITHFTILHEEGGKELSKYNDYGKEPFDYGKTYDLDQVLQQGYIKYFLMHGLTYRTQLLRDMGYRQTEGISYTDTEWCCYPVFKAQTVTFLDIDLYQYNMAREGQTMDPKVLSRSLTQMEKMIRQLIGFFESFDLSGLSETRRSFLRRYYANRIRFLYKCHLIDTPKEMFDAGSFRELDDYLVEACSRNGFGEVQLYPQNKIIRCDILKYWHKHHKRPRSGFESLNRRLDAIMKKLYMTFFR